MYAPSDPTHQPFPSPPRTTEPPHLHIVSRALRETTKSNICITILRGHSTRPKGWVEVLYFRNKAVLGLPISTTSYSRHAVSTVQSPISTADNDWSLIDIDGAKTPRNPFLLPYLYTIIIPRPVSSFHHSTLHSISQILKHKDNYISRVTGNYSTSKYPVPRE